MAEHGNDASPVEWEIMKKLNRMQEQIIRDHVPYVGEGGKETEESKENLQKKLKNAEKRKSTINDIPIQASINTHY